MGFRLASHYVEQGTRVQFKISNLQADIIYNVLYTIILLQ